MKAGKEQDNTSEKTKEASYKAEVISREPKISRELEGWIEKVEKKEDMVLDTVVRDDQGQVILKSAEEGEVAIKLPLSKSELLWGVKEKVNKAIRWLAEQCLRLIKLYPKRVKFREGEIK